MGYNHGVVGEILEKVFPEGRVAVGDIAALTGRVAGFARNPRAVPAPRPFYLQAMLDETLALYQDMTRPD